MLPWHSHSPCGAQSSPRSLPRVTLGLNCSASF
jgi:hypothetical protein